MVGNAIDHLGFAGAAMPFGAREQHVHSGIEQDVQNCFARRHGNGTPAAIKSHLEATIEGRIVSHRTFPLLNCPYSA